MKKEATLSLLFNIFGLLISMALISFLSKKLDLDEFGIYQFIITLIGIISIFSFNGINIIINRNILLNKDETFHSIMWSNYRIVFLIFLIFLSISLLIKHFFYFEKIDYFIISLLFLPLIGLEKYQSVLYGKQKFKEIRFLNFLNILFYSFLAFLIVSFLENYLYIFISMFFVKLVIVITGLKIALNSLILKEKLVDIKNDLKEGYKLSILSFYNIGIGYIDKLILGLIDMKLLAIYAIGILIPLKIKDQLKSVLNIYIQKWAKEGEYNYLINIDKYFKWILIIILIISILSISLSSWYIPVIFDKNYLESKNVLVIISISVPLILISFIYETFIIVFHNTEVYKKVTYTKQIVYIISLLLLVPFYNIIGIAIAFFIRSVYDCMINYYYFKVYRKEKLLKE